MEYLKIFHILMHIRLAADTKSLSEFHFRNQEKSGWAMKANEAD